ncbi:type II toxin-antitoxin system ribonuclease VapC1 [soil metagenome]
MIVVDASVVLELILQTATAAAVADELLDDEQSLHAPHLIDLEVAQVLRRYVRAGTLGVRRAREALDDLAALRIERYTHFPLLDRVWSLRDHLSAYDAAYVALAEGLGAPLLTSDARLARAPGHRARIRLLGAER